MAELNNRFGQASAGTRADIDVGLRAYMSRVYNYMAGGIGLTGLVAYAVNQFATLPKVGAGRAALTPFGQLIYTSPLRFVIMLAPLAFVFFLAFRVYKMSQTTAQIAFWLFSAVMGLSLSAIFLVYTGTSITRVFFATSAAFAALSLYGYTTKKDLSGFGQFLFMGVIGLIVVGLLNMFIQSSALQMALSALGVLIFAGLTAYDTQQIKDNYYAIAHDSAALGKSAIMGALNLYLDFINMFTSLLGLAGDRE